jgi:hypothetical protein
MNDRVQALEPLRISEHTGSKRRAIDFVSSIENLSAEFPHDFIVRLSGLREHLVPERVGLNEQASIAGKRFADERFAAAEATGKTHF